MKSNRQICRALAAALLLACTDLSADIYRWKDSNGVINFGDQPPADVDATLIKTEELPASSRPAAAEPQTIRDYLEKLEKRRAAERNRQAAEAQQQAKKKAEADKQAETPDGNASNGDKPLKTRDERLRDFNASKSSAHQAQKKTHRERVEEAKAREPKKLSEKLSDLK